jgi:hypothetical protein
MFRPRFSVSWAVASALAAAGPAFAQESLRNSLAGDAAAAAQRQQKDSQLYTYKLGDFKLLAVPSLEVDYNDNVVLQKTGKESDVILKPLLQLVGSYPITEPPHLFRGIGI